MVSDIVLGVDTSLRSTGWGVVEARGNSFRALDFGLIKNAPSLSHSRCFQEIHRHLVGVIVAWKPHAMAVEGVFFCKNVKTAVILGEARGVVLLCGAIYELPIYEYPPRRIKQSLTGTGDAQKSQVASMVQRLLNLDKPPVADAADALAIAICHIQNKASVLGLEPKQI